MVELSKKIGVKNFRGSEDDKLIRYRDTAEFFELDFMVIVDGDDPFCSVEHLEDIIDYAEKNIVDYVQYEGLPLGATGFGIKLLALERMCHEKTQKNTEVWQHLFKDNPKYKSILLEEKNPLFNRPHIRMTLDYNEDYQFFITVEQGLNKENKSLDFNHVMEFLEAHPEIVEINNHVQEIYNEHLKNSMIDSDV